MQTISEPVPEWCALEIDRLLRLGYRLCKNPECVNLAAGDDFCADCSDEHGTRRRIMRGLFYALWFELLAFGIGYFIFCLIRGW